MPDLTPERLERLRAAVEDRLSRDDHGSFLALLDERDRLRVALEEIRDYTPDHLYPRQRVADMRAIARAALNPGGGE